MAARQRAMELMERKEAIETQLSEQFTILSANQSTMNTPLVDPEGFPRSDIDVWAVRHARVRIIELKNDLNGIVDAIAVALASMSKDDAASSSNAEASAPLTNGILHPDDTNTLRAFARVDGVAPNSPAATAGLRREDELVQFGRLTAEDFRQAPRSLQPLATLVAEYENRALEVVIRREGSVLTLNFTPRAGWGGRGLLGCHIVPV
ncbi:SubName: Full=Related to 26S proteasome non-ATPase regulatory subunit 9 {ECO:0000313/EMBL:CCA67644.1} [Serendipita indica DSM 11827]|nr:SubName: Full=Related to 26S proteasome non-ATPase regulatory subunit 9 {ECO:0000313/EMBL:CCA67644.1} [Serendipita indica DSM 11827]